MHALYSIANQCRKATLFTDQARAQFRVQFYLRVNTPIMWEPLGHYTTDSEPQACAALNSFAAKGRINHTRINQEIDRHMAAFGGFPTSR